MSWLRRASRLNLLMGRRISIPIKYWKSAVEQMKRLTVAGKRLSTYISQHVKDRFADKLDYNLYKLIVKPYNFQFDCDPEF